MRHVIGRNPVRVILDHNLSLSGQLRIAKTAPRIKTIVIHSVNSPLIAKKRYWRGADYIYLRGKDNIPPKLILKVLAQRSITSLLLEGGSNLASGFVRAGAVDRYAFCFGPMILGQGLMGLNHTRINNLKNSIKLSNINIEQFGNDILLTGYPEKRKG